MDWCLYDNGLRHERVNVKILTRFNPLVPFYNIFYNIFLFLGTYIEINFHDFRLGVIV